MGLQSAACHNGRHRSTSTGVAQREATEKSALRLYRCARCGQVALVCRRCEHGQIYCAKPCAKQARLESQRRAGARYQRTKEGRRDHADRQTSYREDRLQKVTHQGPLAEPILVKPSTSGTCAFVGLPEKEDPDVFSSALRILPLASVLSVALQLPEPTAAPSVTPHSATTTVRLQEHTEKLCHFCGRTSSRYLRRDFLIELRRRHLGRRKRGPP